MTLPLPRLTPEALRGAVVEMCDEACQMVRLTRDAFLHPLSSHLEQVGALGRDLHLREKRLTDHVAMQIREYPWSLGTAEHLAFLPAALERIGDSVEVLALFSRSAALLDGIAAAIRTGERAGLSRVREEGEQFQGLCDQASAGHQERLLRGICASRASSVFMAMLDYFREIERYTRRMSLDLEKALAAT